MDIKTVLEQHKLWLGGDGGERANLRSADLRNADLRSANLSYAEGFNPNFICGLLFLLEQPGKIRAYKLVLSNGYGPYNGGIYYEVGKHYSVDNANQDVNELCGAGINVALLPWCIREWIPTYRILIVEFEAKDIAAIPTTTDGKFRLHRCDVVGEKNLKELGLEE